MPAEPLKLMAYEHHDGFACPFDVSEEVVVVDGDPMIIGVGDTREASITNLKLKLDRMSKLLAAISSVIR
jgi:hypothetical protein